MTRSPAKYFAISGIQVRAALAYPLDTLSRSVLIVIFVITFASLWSATFAETGRTIGGLTLRQTLWYLVVAEALALGQPRIASLISQSVKDGSVALQLIRPYSFLLFQLAARAGDTVPGFLTALAVGGAAASIAVGPPPAPWGLLAFLPALALGWLLSFLMSALIGMAAFVVEDTTALEWIYSKLVLVAGGVIIPLDFLPGAARTIAQALPFAGAAYAPARLFVAPAPGVAARLLALELAWVVALGLILAFAYRRAVRRLEVNGG